jgi:hypothetical protein
MRKSRAEDAMGRLLTTHEATVQTVQVEIKVLKVGKKQVTMGMFRQLPHDLLLDPETVQLRGVPWGHVRYRWDGDGSHWCGRGPKLHVVWQLGDELRRGWVSEEPDRQWMTWYQKAIQDDMDDWVLARLPSARQFELKTRPGIDDGQDVVIDNTPIHTDLDTLAVKVLRDYWYWRDRDPEDVAEILASQSAKRDQKRQALHAYQALYNARFGQTSLPEIMISVSKQKLHAHLRDRDAYQAEWAQQWQVLSALPQLFIAV